MPPTFRSARSSARRGSHAEGQPVGRAARRHPRTLWAFGRRAARAIGRPLEPGGSASALAWRGGDFRFLVQIHNPRPAWRIVAFISATLGVGVAARCGLKAYGVARRASSPAARASSSVVRSRTLSAGESEVRSRTLPAEDSESLISMISAMPARSQRLRVGQSRRSE